MRAAWLLLTGAIALAGCNTTGKGTYGSVSAPTTALSGVAVTIAPSGFFPAGVVGVPCATVAVPAVDLAITASAAVTVDQVTLRLGDGSHVGGPSVTFPNATLTSQFGSTFIAANSTRLLVFNAPFGCTFLPTDFIFADLLISDSSGNTQAMTVSSAVH
jgi:hypothetical protein